MNELEKTLQKILERSLEVAEKTGQFAMEQAPEILEQFFKWHLIAHSLGALLGVLILIPGILFLKNGHKEQCINDDFEDGFGYYAAGIISFGTGFAFFCVNIHTVIFILVAPKIYLIEYFIR